MNTTANLLETLTDNDTYHLHRISQDIFHKYFTQISSFERKQVILLAFRQDLIGLHIAAKLLTSNLV